ncbi:tetratricopeptide repeat protein [Flexithrix dorotheae]|uniref:tetratricopeptide repeat protein n=1 Tax=Flexithrix dorotheae TaxID=70993 RepID=UPI00146DA7E1|nr:tetratricopeptide repeat protein [Flexithrix dorotheae]
MALKNSHIIIYLFFLANISFFHIEESNAQDQELNIDLLGQKANRNFAKADSILKHDNFINAIIFFDKALEDYERIYGKENKKLALVFQTIAELLSEDNHPDEAAKYGLKALEILELQSEKDWGNIGKLNLSLGNIYKYQQLNNVAIDYYEKALSAFSTINSPAYDATFVELQLALGNLYYENRDFKGAISYFQNANNFINKNIGTELHHNVAIIYNNIGNAYLEADSLELGLQNLHKSIGITKEIFGDKVEDIAKTYTTLSMVHFGNFQYDSAIVYAKKAIEVYNSLSGNYDEIVLDYQLYLAKQFFWAQSFETSSFWYEEYISKYFETTENKLVTANLNFQVAKSFSDNYSFHHALNFYDKALILYQEYYQDDDVQLGNLTREIGLIFYKLGYFEKAENYLNESVRIFENADSVAENALTDSYQVLGEVYAKENQHEKSNFYLLKTETALTAENNRRASVLNQLADNYYHLGQYDSALIFAQMEADFYLEVYEGIHIAMAESYILLGNIYAKKNDLERSIYYYENSPKYNKKIFMKESKLVLDANRFLAYIYAKNGDLGKSKLHAQLALNIQRGIR